MASKADLALAKRLLSARVLSEDTLREAFAQQAELDRRGRPYPIQRILQARKDIPPGSLDMVGGPTPLETQPFADYELHDVLGEGGSSVVYGGVYLPNGAPVAVKVLDPVHALREDFLQRFRNEARMLVELEHDHIVAGYEFGHEGGWHYFSMDRVEGLTVLEVIDRRGHLDNDEALSITWQTANALRYLHGSGYLHRDIKPSNLMIEESGHVRLIDLGLVRAMDEAAADAEEETMTVGTVEYLSPEQARGRRDLDPRSDIYSLGLSLYHMAVGEVPFQGETDYEVMAKQIMSTLDTQKLKQRRIPPEIHFFVTKMTSKDRESRFETLEELEAAVAAYVPDGIVAVDLGPEPPPPPPPPPPVAKPVAPPPAATPVARPVTAPPPAKPPIAPPVAKPPAAPPVAKPPAAPPVARPPAVPPQATPPKAAPPPAPKPPVAPPEAGQEETPAKGDAPVPRKHRGDAPVPRRRRRGGTDDAPPRRRRR